MSDLQVAVPVQQYAHEFNQTPIVGQTNPQLPEPEVQVSELERMALISNATKLSTGVYVVFQKLNRSISTDLTIKTFNNINTDKKGKIITDNLSNKEQMNMAKSISDYHSILIQQGVTLLGTIEDYKETLGLTDNWLRKLKKLVDNDLYDFDDEDDVQFLFLRYYAFQSEDDWAILSLNTINS